MRKAAPEWLSEGYATGVDSDSALTLIFRVTLDIRVSDKPVNATEE
jgi:hypothetical protein